MADLRTATNAALIESRELDALRGISDAIGHYARILGVENAERKANLDVRNLTVVVEGAEGRRDFLWEIGSGANWMGYHIATLLALHEHFLNLKDSAVPQFLFLDQTSQAFFPGGYKKEGGKTARKEESVISSEDIDRVRRAFAALSEAVKRTEKRLQIVVLKYADEETWQGIPHVALVERWRKDDFLVTAGWLKT